MSKIVLKTAALEKMKNSNKTYTLYMAARGG